MTCQRQRRKSPPLNSWAAYFDSGRTGTNFCTRRPLTAAAAAGLFGFAGVLQALALANGIVDETHVADAREALGKGLIGLGSLAIRGVAAAPHHAGPWRGRTFGEVEIGRGGEIRTALEDHLFDLVGVALDDAGGPRIERGLFRPRAEALLDFRPHVAHLFLGVGFGVQGGAAFVGAMLDLA